MIIHNIIITFFRYLYQNIKDIIQYITIYIIFVYKLRIFNFIKTLITKKYLLNKDYGY